MHSPRSKVFNVSIYASGTVVAMWVSPCCKSTSSISLLDFLPKHNCMLRIVHCLGVEQANKEKNADDALTLPVFVVVATKFKSLPMPVSRPLGN